MMQPVDSFLATMFWHWRNVADQTVGELGEETAGLFIKLASDAYDMHKAIVDTYSEAERLHSLVFAEFLGLWKELNWFQMHFLAGNYRLVLSQLRFNWDRLFRALHVDAYGEQNPTASDVPGRTLNEKHDWLMSREDRLNWRTLIAPTLARLFTAEEPGEIEAHFKPLWERLNHCVHATGQLRERMSGESGLLVQDAFDPDWARDTHADAVEVFEVIWLAILSRFPLAVPALLADPCAFKACSATPKCVGD